jgi:hypothetical protein
MMKIAISEAAFAAIARNAFGRVRERRAGGQRAGRAHRPAQQDGCHPAGGDSGARREHERCHFADRGGVG